MELVLGIAFLLYFRSSIEAVPDTLFKKDHEPELVKNEIYLWKKDMPEWKQHYATVAKEVSRVLIQDRYNANKNEIFFDLISYNWKMPVWLFLENEVGLRVESVTVNSHGFQNQYIVKYKPRSADELQKFVEGKTKPEDLKENGLSYGCSIYRAPKSDDPKPATVNLVVEEDFVEVTTGNTPCECGESTELSEEERKKMDEFFKKKGFTKENL